MVVFGRWYYRLDPIAIPLLVCDQQWEDALVALALRELEVYTLGIACSILDRQRPRPSVKVELCFSLRRRVAGRKSLPPSSI